MKKSTLGLGGVLKATFLANILADFFQDGLAAAQRFFGGTLKAASAAADAQRFLASASFLTGTALQQNVAIAEQLRSSFGTTRADAQSLVAVALNFAAAAGRIEDVDKFVVALGDSAIASGRKIGELREILEQVQTLQDEGVEKLLGGRQPSQIYDDYAAALGTTANKLDFVQKRQAIFNEILERGGLVAGAAAARLGTTAGQLELFDALLIDLQASLGVAILQNETFRDTVFALTEALKGQGDATARASEFLQAIMPLLKGVGLAGVVVATGLATAWNIVAGVISGVVDAFISAYFWITRNEAAYESFRRQADKSAQDRAKGLADISTGGFAAFSTVWNLGTGPRDAGKAAGDQFAQGFTSALEAKQFLEANKAAVAQIAAGMTGPYDAAFLKRIQLAQSIAGQGARSTAGSDKEAERAAKKAAADLKRLEEQGTSAISSIQREVDDLLRSSGLVGDSFGAWTAQLGRFNDDMKGQVNETVALAMKLRAAAGHVGFSGRGRDLKEERERSIADFKGTAAQKAQFEAEAYRKYYAELQNLLADYGDYRKRVANETATLERANSLTTAEQETAARVQSLREWEDEYRKVVGRFSAFSQNTQDDITRHRQAVEGAAYKEQLGRESSLLADIEDLRLEAAQSEGARRDAQRQREYAEFKLAVSQQIADRKRAEEIVADFRRAQDEAVAAHRRSLERDAGAGVREAQIGAIVNRAERLEAQRQLEFFEKVIEYRGKLGELSDENIQKANQLAAVWAEAQRQIAAAQFAAEVRAGAQAAVPFGALDPALDEGIKALTVSMRDQMTDLALWGATWSEILAAIGGEAVNFQNLRAAILEVHAAMREQRAPEAAKKSFASLSKEILLAESNFQMLGDGIGRALLGVIQGTQTFGEGMRQLFFSLIGDIAAAFGDLIIKMGVANIASGNIAMGIAQLAAGASLRALAAVMGGLAGAAGGGASAPAGSGGASGGGNVASFSAAREARARRERFDASGQSGERRPDALALGSAGDANTISGEIDIHLIGDDGRMIKTVRASIHGGKLRDAVRRVS